MKRIELFLTQSSSCCIKKHYLYFHIFSVAVYSCLLFSFWCSAQHLSHVKRPAANIFILILFWSNVVADCSNAVVIPVAMFGGFLWSMLFVQQRKLHIRRNKNKVNSVETGRTVIAHLFPWSDQDNYSSPRFSNYSTDKNLQLLIYL